MTVEQQIDQAVEDLKCILCQSAKSRQEAQRISDILDSIGYQLKSANSTLKGNFSKATLESMVSKMYAEKSRL